MHEKPSEIEKKETEENQANKEHGSLPVIPRNDANSYHAGKPNYEGKRPQRSRWKRRWIRSKHWFRAPLPDWIQVIFALAIVYFAWSSGEETRRIMNAAEKNAEAAASFAKSTDDIRQKIGKAEEDFRVMASSAQESIKATLDAVRLDKRAWVGPQKFLIEDMKEGEFAKISVILANTGRSPALNVRCSLAHAGGMLGQEHFFERVTENASSGVLFPSVELKITVPTNERMTIQHIKPIEGGLATTFVYVSVRYDDIFGRPHRTKACGFLAPDLSSFQVCRTGNYAD